mgnify:CR=1 FL=1
MHIIVGLGNPGEEYEGTRHNAGFLCVVRFAAANDFPEWKEDKKIRALVSEASIGKEKTKLVLPQTFMNKSGASVKPLVGSKKAASRLIVVHDDLDLPLGSFKISFGKSSGGHRGVESVMKGVGTKDFVRVRVGIAPATPGGKLRKPTGEKKVLDFIIGKLRKPELETLKKLSKKVSEALLLIVSEGREKAMSTFN